MVIFYSYVSLPEGMEIHRDFPTGYCVQSALGAVVRPADGVSGEQGLEAQGATSEPDWKTTKRQYIYIYNIIYDINYEYIYI